MRDLRFGVQTSAWCSVLASVVITLSGCSGEDSTPGGSAGTSTTGGTAGTAGTGGGGTGGSAGGTAGGTGGTAGASTGGAGAGGGGAGGTAGGGAGGTAGGGAGGTAGGGSGGDGGSGGGGAFTLTSPDHAEGAEFADEYTCAAAGFMNSILPELVWTAGPAGTMSYAITFLDVTLTEGAAPNDNGYHWAIYNIPATTLGLPEGFSDAASIGATQISVPPGKYLGPCPALGGGNDLPHSYEFTIYALPTASVTVSGTGTAGVKNADAAFKAASPLGTAKLTGISSAAQP